MVAGQVIDFPHLEPFEMRVNSEKVGRELRIHVRFSSHCFSEGFDPKIHSPAEATVPNGGGPLRVFNPERYNLSHQLPAAIAGLSHPKADVHQTVERRNWLHSLVVEGADGPYLVFFELRRAPKEDRLLQDMNLFVESAYPQGSGKPPGILGKIRFVLLAGKLYKGEPTSTRR